MDLEEAMFARLSAVSAITTIVGSHIYWILRPQGDQVPAVVMRRSGGFGEDTLDSEETDFFHSTVTIDCFGVSDEQTHDLARAVKAELKPPRTVSGFTFDASDVSEPIDLGELGVPGWQHRAVLDCVIRHGAET